MKATLIPASLIALALAAVTILLGGCDRATSDEAQAEAKRAGNRIELAFDRTGEKLAEAAHRTGETIGEGTTHITTGERTAVAVSGVSDETKAKLSDSAITASIKAGLLADPDLHVLGIDVDTQGGVVALNGAVKDDSARTRAGHIAGAVKGVREVHNHLTVKQG